MISGRDIICIASIEWDFLWQGHQEINLRLAQAGNRILYIENTGVRSPGLRDARRILKRLRSWLNALLSGGVRQVAENIYVCSPLVLPPFGSIWQRHINRRLLLPLVRRIARRIGITDAILWTYLPTDTAHDLINLLRTPQSIVVYYCIADFAQLTPRVKQLRQSERAITEMSDVVFAQGPELNTLCVQWNKNVHIFPFGVNLDAFPLEDTNGHRGRGEAKAEQGPLALRGLARPLIGYIGGLHRHIDFGLLIEMARARPHWSWVFVGAIQTEAGELAALPNVYLLGQQQHPDLFRYLRAFDVCIVPYVNSLYTATVVPTKINEYLAVGKPVVSTELPAVLEFNEQHNVLLTSKGRPDDFLQSVEAALRSPLDEATILRRRKVAALGDWQQRLEAMSELIEAELIIKAGRDKAAGQEATHNRPLRD